MDRASPGRQGHERRSMRFSGMRHRESPYTISPYNPLRNLGEGMTRVIPADLGDPGHAAALVELLDEYARSPTGGGTPLSAFARENLPAQLRTRPNIHVLLAFDGERAITREWRGRGVGRLLLQHAEQLARRLGCCKLTLEVLGGNDNAQALYRSCGYAPYQLDPAVGSALLWQRVL